MDKTGQPADMKTIVQVNIYRLQNNVPEFLLLKRIDEDDHFWQPVSEEVRNDGSIGDAMKQAARAQAGISDFKRMSAEMYTYEWYAHGQQGRDIVFAAEVGLDTEVYIDKERYDEYAWFKFDDAVHNLKWDGNKEAIRRLRGQIESDLFEAAKSGTAVGGTPEPEYTPPAAATNVFGQTDDAPDHQPDAEATPEETHQDDSDAARPAIPSETAGQPEPAAAAGSATAPSTWDTAAAQQPPQPAQFGPQAPAPYYGYPYPPPYPYAGQQPMMPNPYMQPMVYPGMPAMPGMSGMPGMTGMYAPPTAPAGAYGQQQPLTNQASSPQAWQTNPYAPQYPVQPTAPAAPPPQPGQSSPQPAPPSQGPGPGVIPLPVYQDPDATEPLQLPIDPRRQQPPTGGEYSNP